GTPANAKTGIDNNYNNGPNGIVVVNSRTVWAGDGNSTIKVCSLGGVLLKTISTGGNARVNRGCFDPHDQTVLFVNDLERNFQHQTSFPFFTIWNAKTYAQVGTKKTLDSAYMNPATLPATFAYIANYYPLAAPINPDATGGVGSCIYETTTGHFWLAIPECWNQTAQLAYLSEFDFTTNLGSGKTFTANANSGGDPNSGHGCVAEIHPTTGAL